MTKPKTKRGDKESHRLYSRWHYHQNSAAYKAKAKKRNKKIADEGRAIILSHLVNHPCIDCGESDPVVLDFDHRDPSDKGFTIATYRRLNVEPHRLIREIAKCEIRCANCHRRRTYKQMKYKSKG